MSLTNKVVELGATFHYRSEETTGTSATEDINLNVGSIGGSPTLNQTGGGDDGSAAITFSGSSRQYLSWDGAAAVDGEVLDDNVRANRTTAVAFRTNSVNSAQMLYQQGARDGGYFIYLNSLGKLYLNLTNGSGSNYNVNLSGVATNTWYFVVAIQNDDNDEIRLRLYNSSGLVTSGTIDISSATSEALSISFVALGTARGALTDAGANIRNHGNNEWDSNEKHWNGEIDEAIYFSGVALTNDEAAQLADSYFSGTTVSGPAVANSATNTANSNAQEVAVDISGWTLGVGDLIVAIGTIDGGEAGNTAITQSDFTEGYSTQNTAGTITGCMYHKILVSGDTSWTEIELTWTGSNEKAVLRVFRFASGAHDGFDVVGTPNTNDGATEVTLPPITYIDNVTSIAAAHINGNGSVSTNPAGYTTDDSTSATGGSNCTQWVGTDAITGDRSARAFILSSPQSSVVNVFGVAIATGGGSALVQVANEIVDITSGTFTIRGITRFISEAVTISEALLSLRGITRAVLEVISILESFLSLRGITRLIAEVISITEGVLSRRGLLRLVNETVSIVESALSFRGLTRLLSETITITDSPIKVTGLVKLVSESVSVLEAVIQIVSAIVPGTVIWTELTILPKVQFLIDYIGPQTIGKLKINNGGESDL